MSSTKIAIRNNNIKLVINQTLKTLKCRLFVDWNETVNLN